MKHLKDHLVTIQDFQDYLWSTNDYNILNPVPKPSQVARIKQLKKELVYHQNDIAREFVNYYSVFGDNFQKYNKRGNIIGFSTIPAKIVILAYLYDNVFENDLNSYIFNHYLIYIYKKCLKNIDNPTIYDKQYLKNELRRRYLKIMEIVNKTVDYDLLLIDSFHYHFNKI